MTSSIKEDVQQEQHQETWKEEAKENNLSSDAPCSVAGVSTLKASNEEPPTINQQMISPADANTEESMDLKIDPVTEAKNKIICSAELEEIVTAEENIPEKETPKGQDLSELRDPYVEEKNNSSADTQSVDNTEACEAQEDRKDAADEREICHQQKSLCNIVNEGLGNESPLATSNAESQQEVENVREEENSETEELASKTVSGSQSATVLGKKKKRKRRGKKKGGTHEDKNQQKDEDGKTKVEVELSTTECEIDNCATKAFKDQKLGQSEHEQGRQTAETKEPAEELLEPQMDHVANEYTEQGKTVEVVSLTETQDYAVSPPESRTHPSESEQDNQQPVESVLIENVQSPARDQHPESNISASESPATDAEIEQTEKEQPSQESEGLAQAVTVESTECKDDCNEMTDHHTDHSLKTEAVEKPTKTRAHIERTAVACGVSKEEQDEGQTLEAPLSVSELIVTCEGTENTVSLDRGCPSSMNASNNGEEVEPASITSDTESNYVTNITENTDMKYQGPSNSDIAANGSGSTNSQGSELPLDSCATIRDVAAEMVKEQGMSFEQECSFHTQDKEKPPGSLKEDTTTVPETTGVNKASVDQTDELNVKLSSEADELHAAISNPTDSPRREAPVKQELSESQREKCRNDADSETCCPLDERLPSTHSSEPIQHDSDGGCCDDEEGQSFDFDDMDIEAAIASDLSRTVDQEEAEAAVEAMADESHGEISAPCHSHCEPHGSTQEKPVEASDQVAPQDERSRGNKVSLPHEATSEKKENMADEEGKVINDVEAQNMKQVAGVSVDEGVDAGRHETQNESLPKREEQEDDSRELLQAGKDGKKNSKKGKGKSKEECKMS